jgi:hypothetical protein
MKSGGSARRSVSRVVLKWSENDRDRGYWDVSCFDAEGVYMSNAALELLVEDYNLLEYPQAADAVRRVFPSATVEEDRFDFGPVRIGSMVGR